VITGPENKELLKIAENAAKLAGDFLNSSRISMRQVDVDRRRDVKIRGDKESEKIILSYLKKHTQVYILSEENVQSARKKSSDSLVWIVDPLDGSLNYSRGIPLCCISIGLWQGNRPVLSVVYDFNNKEMFLGVASEGAWLNGQEIKVSNNRKKKQAVLCTGFPINTDFTPDAVRTFIEDIRSYKKVRLLGSAALSLAYVASGRADAYQENDIAIWDVAAGIAIVKAAGGAAQFRASEITHRLIVRAGNRFLQSKVV